MKRPGPAFLVSALLFIVAVPLAVEAQPAGRIPRIGFLGPGPVADWELTKEAFRQELRALGYIEGQNISIEWRFTSTGYD